MNFKVEPGDVYYDKEDHFVIEFTEFMEPDPSSQWTQGDRWYAMIIGVKAISEFHVGERVSYNEKMRRQFLVPASRLLKLYYGNQDEETTI
jgi:hypothetical protein